MMKAKFFAVCLALWAAGSLAQQLPSADIPGSRDSEVVGRLSGALVVSHSATALDQAEFPKSVLKKRDTRVGNNVYVMLADESLVTEGTRARNVYLFAPGVQPFAAVRAYGNTLAAQGAELVYSCKADACAGLVNRAGELGGNWMSLSYDLWPGERLLDDTSSAGRCAQTGYISNQEYRLFRDEATDSEGSFNFNQNLSERRAASVVRALVTQHGIAQSRLFPVGVSFASPVAPNTTEEGREQNRRVKLVKF